MKSIILCTLLITFSALAAAAPADMEAKLALAAVECMKDHNLKVEDFTNIQNGEEDFKPEDVSDDMKCAVHCIMLKMGGMDESGNIKPDAIREMIDDDEKETFEAAYKDCDKINGANPCDTAFLSFSCMASHK